MFLLRGTLHKSLERYLAAGMHVKVAAKGYRMLLTNKTEAVAQNEAAG